MIHHQAIDPTPNTRRSRDQRLPILHRSQLLPHRPANILTPTLLHQLPRLRLRTPIAEHHPRPRLPKQPHRSRTNPPRPARHQHHLAVQRQRNSLPKFSITRNYRLQPPHANPATAPHVTSLIFSVALHPRTRYAYSVRLPRSTTSRKESLPTMKYLYLICRILLGLMFVVFGANILHPFMPMQPPPAGSPAAQFMGVMFPTGWMHHIGFFQVLGGLLVLIGGTASPRPLHPRPHHRQHPASSTSPWEAGHRPRPRRHPARNHPDLRLPRQLRRHLHLQSHPHPVTRRSPGYPTLMPR